MATALSGAVKITCEPSLKKALDMSTVQDSVTTDGIISWALAFGTAADQANDVWHDQRTLAQSATEELDVSGTLLNAFGDTFTPARIKAIFIKTSSGSTANLLVGGAAANAFSTMFSDASDVLVIRGAGGGVMLMAPDATGYVVTGATGDLLKMTHDGSTTEDMVYDIILIGASA